MTKRDTNIYIHIFLHSKTSLTSAVRLRRSRRYVGGRMSAVASFAFFDRDDVTLSYALRRRISVRIRRVLEKNLILVYGMLWQLVYDRLIKTCRLRVQCHN